MRLEDRYRVLDWRPVPGSLEDDILRVIVDFPGGATTREICNATGRTKAPDQRDPYGKVYSTLRQMAELELLIWDEWGSAAYRGVAGQTRWRPIYFDIPESRESEEVERWLTS